MGLNIIIYSIGELYCKRSDLLVNILKAQIAWHYLDQLINKISVLRAMKVRTEQVGPG